MGIFDGREKALEAENASLSSKLADAERSNAVLAKTAKQYADQINALRSSIQANEKTIGALEQRLDDRKDLPEASLTAICIFVRSLGAAMLFSSWAFAAYLALAKGSEESHQLTWALYLFAQFVGLYLLGFGAHTTLRSLSILGSYLSALAVACAAATGLSVMKYVDLFASDQLVALGLVNAIGIPLLIYVERRRAIPGAIKSHQKA